MRFASVGLAGLNEVVDSTIAAHGRDIHSFTHSDAMRNPIHNERLGALVPKLAVNGVVPSIDNIQPISRRLRFNVH